MQLAIHQAVIKCMLNSPTADAAGYCNLFSLGELKQLCRREDKLMSKVKDVQDAIEIMEGFFKAYGKFSDIQLLKLISLFEVRCIMFMFNKRSPSRTTYASIKEIMVSVDGMARLYYDKLPVMPMLAGAAATAAADEPASKKRKNDSGSFRQVGKVSDDELKAKGFTVGVLIERADNKEQFTITQLNADGATISVELVNTDAEKSQAARVAEFFALSGDGDVLDAVCDKLDTAFARRPDVCPIFMTHRVQKHTASKTKLHTKKHDDKGRLKKRGTSSRGGVFLFKGITSQWLAYLASQTRYHNWPPQMASIQLASLNS